MKYRDAIGEDIDAVRELMRSANRDPEFSMFTPDPEAFIETLIMAGQSWVAEDEGKIVGVVSHGYSDGKFYGAGLMVHPDYRGRGVGEGLLEAALSHETRAGFALAPQHLIRMYERAGFRTVGTVMKREAH